MQSTDWSTAAKLLTTGAVGIIPTDTLYGFTALVSQPKAIDRIYEVKGRVSGRPLVLLAASIEQIVDTFPVIVSDQHRRVIQEYNDHPTSFIYDLDPATRRDWQLHNSNEDNLAIRIPHGKTDLLVLLEKVGPIVSSSVNISGQPPLGDPQLIIRRFGKVVDFIVEAGECLGPASRIIKIGPDGEVEILRDK